MSLLKAGFAVAFAALTVAACSSGQGDECTKDSDCGANLSCQTIGGRGKLYCCPTPAQSSDYANCHADLSAVPPSSSSSGSADASKE
jgi:hypothetical protein